jgi:protein-L-isoaspartate(D-aspartate) O-methyltransferase
VKSGEVKFARERLAMVTSQLVSRGIRDQRVLDVMADVPRELFVSPGQQHEAYADRPVPIAAGQTISQPYVVALMTQELDVQPHHRVLDVGAGSGYQTAILARLARQVFAVDRIPELTQGASAVLQKLGLDNVTLTTGDGTLGWPEHAPYDRIICGAAGPDVPPSWIDQLVEGGRIVTPVGGEDWQVLIAVEKRGGQTHRREICGVRFVHLIGREGWPE